jgi:hypothetical protein
VWKKAIGTISRTLVRKSDMGMRKNHENAVKHTHKYAAKSSSSSVSTLDLPAYSQLVAASGPNVGGQRRRHRPSGAEEQYSTPSLYLHKTSKGTYIVCTRTSSNCALGVECEIGGRRATSVCDETGFIQACHFRHE